jgi:DNA invertase Pin-like site-specific DNA recombinase
MARKSRKHLYDGEIPETSVDAENQRTIFNAAGYVRLSVSDKKKQGDSIETQRNIIENFVATTPGIRLSEIYTDIEKTGTNFDRPGFLRMLSDIECGKINCIIVKDLTRFGRNAIDGGYYLERVLPSLGVRFIAVTDMYDSMDGSCNLIIGLKNIIAESYALDIGRKVRSVHRQNISDGRFVGRLAPYGYRKDQNDCHKLIIDEETAPVVAQIFQWAFDGASMTEIGRRLSDCGVVPPAVHNHLRGYNGDKQAGNKYWKRNTVKEILENRMYLGEMVQGKTQTVNGRSVKVDRSKWVIVPGTHDAIISADMFDRVQKTLTDTAELAKSLKTEPFSENIFKGKIYCCTCGFPMNRQRQNKDGTYWHRCNSQLRYGKNACTVVSVKEADLIKELLAMLRKYAEELLGECAASQNSAITDNFDEELQEINSGLDNDGRILKSLFESLISGLIDQYEFGRLKTAYESKIESLSKQADEVRDRRHGSKLRIEEYKNMLDAFLHMTENEDFTAEIINTLVSVIKVHPDKSFDVQLNFKDEYITSRYYVPPHLRLHGGNRRSIENGGLEERYAQ